MKPLITLCIATVSLTGFAVVTEQPLLPLNSVHGVQQTWTTNTIRTLEVVRGEGNTTDGNGAIRFGAVAKDKPGSQYFGIMIPLPQPVNLDELRLVFDARCETPDIVGRFYFRAYNRGEKKPAWSFTGQPFKRKDWLTISLQRGMGANGVNWEPSMVQERKATAVDRIELVIGTHTAKATVSVCVDNLRTAPALTAVAGLQAPKKLIRDTILVQNRQARAVVLHPDSPAGREAATVIVEAIHKRTGVTLPARPGTSADRQPSQTAILLGNVDTNPAMLLFYARYLTPADVVCPGAGGALVHTVFNPFGKGVNAIVVGSSDNDGLMKAAGLFADAVGQQPQGADLVLPRLFTAKYGEAFLKRFSWAGKAPSAKRLQDGLKDAQQRLDKGAHTSLAGLLQTIALRYLLTGHDVEAKLFVAVWDLYAKSAVADARKYGGAWGFDSDFPSSHVVAGWDVIEHDPVLTDEERLRVTKAMARWLTEAVIPKCAGAVNSTRVLFNHQTFPALGALFAGLYFTSDYDTIEGRTWLDMADQIFKRQAGYFKSHEDCNGYQWLSNGHLMRYAVARPDFTVFVNGNAKRITDYCIGTMDNLGYQVPYGDTGTWKCWNSEMVCLDIFSFITNDPSTLWAGAFKRQVKNTAELLAFNRTGEGVKPDRFNGVRVWPLEPAYYSTFPAEGQPPLEKCFDKITFREAMDPQAAYLLLDGLSNGGHKHLDGNSLPRLTQFDRIWLADNDYFKAQVKYHNSLLVFKDGESSPIPQYCELLGAGETSRYGFSRTRMANYTGVDWDRAVVWLKTEKAFVVLDRIVPREKGRYQLRSLWHGVGAAEISGNGMLLTQKGPSLRIDLAPGPDLTLHNDTALGENWRGYPHAEPVVRSLNAIASVDLDAGEPYLFATALHGKPDGTVTPWQVLPLTGADGALVKTDTGNIGILLKYDASVIVTDGTGLTTRKPKAMIAAGAAAKPLKIVWEQRLPASNITRIAAGKSNILVATREGTLFALKPDGTQQWTAQIGCQLNDVTTADLDRDGNDEIILARQDCYVGVLDNTGKELWKQQLKYYRRPAYVNLVRTGDLDGDGVPEVIAGAENWRFYAFKADGTPLWNYESVHPSRSGAVADLDGDGKAEVMCGTHYYSVPALRGDGTRLWAYSHGPIAYDVTTGSFDGNKTRGVILGSGDGCVHYLATNGKLRMKFNTGDEVKNVLAADIDADGKDEILAGSLSHYVYCFGADGKRRWAADLGAGVSALTSTGRRLIVAGTLNGKVVVLDGSGSVIASSSMTGRIMDLLSDGPTVVAATEDGRLCRVSVDNTR